MPNFFCASTVLVLNYQRHIFLWYAWHSFLPFISPASWHPVFLGPTKMGCRLGRSEEQLHLGCQVFLDFQREIHMCGSVRRTQLQASPKRAAGCEETVWKDLVSATNLPSRTRSTRTLELPRRNWRQRQLMQETECTECRTYDASYAQCLFFFSFFSNSVWSALLIHSALCCTCT